MSEKPFSGITVTSIPDQKAHLWATTDLEVDRDGRVRAVTLSSRWGVLRFGARSDGGVGFIFSEQGGGGAVTLPFFVAPGGQIHIGLLLEDRANLSDSPTLDIIGGFKDPGEGAAEAQARETAEEAGLDAVRAFELPGVPGVSNRFYFEADVENGSGVHSYALEIPYKWVWPSSEGSETYCLTEHSGAAPSVLDSMKKVVFLPWREALRRTPDALARAAVALLLAEVAAIP